MDEIERIERRLKLHDLRVLISVVQAGSMGKAAERLGTSQPAVSRTIADLEHALGVRLLDRSPRGIEATPYGRALINPGIAAFDEQWSRAWFWRFPPITRRLSGCRSSCRLRADHSESSH